MGEERFFNFFSKAETSKHFPLCLNDDIERHLAIDEYNGFKLTGAIRPGYGLEVIPATGFRFDSYQDPCTNTSIPVIIISASREILFDLFMDLLSATFNALSQADVVLEIYDNDNAQCHQDFFTEHKDISVLESALYDFEDILLDDGYFGIAIFDRIRPMELQFDSHKLLIIYNFKKIWGRLSLILQKYRITEKPKMKVISQSEHVHISNEKFKERIQQLLLATGIDPDCDTPYFDE